MAFELERYVRSRARQYDRRFCGFCCRTWFVNGHEEVGVGGQVMSRLADIRNGSGADLVIGRVRDLQA